MMHLGIDLSKRYFDATLRVPKGEKVHGQFENNAAGFKVLATWLKKHKAKVVHACMEATNIYWEALAAFLHAAGHRVSVVNPARIKGFAMSQLRRNKTDKQDSDVIVDFCYASNPDAWRPPSPQQQKLRALVRCPRWNPVGAESAAPFEQGLGSCCDPQTAGLAQQAPT